VLPPSFCQDLFILKSAQAVTLAGSIGFIERSAPVSGHEEPRGIIRV
jgi:hypothetical protein